jgi:uncharacterized membrane protein
MDFRSFSIEKEKVMRKFVVSSLGLALAISAGAMPVRAQKIDCHQQYEQCIGEAYDDYRCCLGDAGDAGDLGDTAIRCGRKDSGAAANLTVQSQRQICDDRLVKDDDECRLQRDMCDGLR